MPSLCPLSATRLQSGRQPDLAGRGCSPAVIPSWQLGTEEDLARADDNARDNDDAPETWTSWV
jgi:hypothetical protein